MEVTHVAVQGTNRSSPPRSANRVAIPLDQLWSQGQPEETRRQVLRILSRAAARLTVQWTPRLTTPPCGQEVDDE
jgi:hypothetical protein